LLQLWRHKNVLWFGIRLKGAFYDGYRIIVRREEIAAQLLARP